MLFIDVTPSPSDLLQRDLYLSSSSDEESTSPVVPCAKVSALVSRIGELEMLYLDRKRDEIDREEAMKSKDNAGILLSQAVPGGREEKGQDLQAIVLRITSKERPPRKYDDMQSSTSTYFKSEQGSVQKGSNRMQPGMLHSIESYKSSLAYSGKNSSDISDNSTSESDLNVEGTQQHNDKTGDVEVKTIGKPKVALVDAPELASTRSRPSR